jgi:ATP-dependent DNA helicase RecG
MLATKLSDLKGVGAVTSEHLQSAGLNTIDDLINYYPRRYDDYSNLTTIDLMQPGKVSLKVSFGQIKTRQARRGLFITESIAEDDSGKVKVVWFNQPYRAKSLRIDKKYLISGEYAFQSGRMQIVNPSIELTEDINNVKSGRIIAVYPERKNLKSALIRKLIINVLTVIETLPEILPGWLIKKYNLFSYAQAIKTIHLPENSEDIQKAKERLGFDELFVLIMASKQLKDENIKLQSMPVAFKQKIAKDFVNNLPFKLTDAQRKCAWQIYKDIDSQRPMNRLIEGDVGSGKTAVAAMASIMVAEAGLQVAFMAPTELLAQQHAETLAKLLSHSSIKGNIALLTGSVKPKAKKQIYSLLKENKISIVVGTHALLQEKVDWHKLGLLVVDEQHRFGVNQRHKLLLKSGHMPHVLCMTATPIPRSLALTVYGELDISILDQAPSIRAGTETHLVSPNSTKQMFDSIKNQLKAGRQAYIVCPLISESEVLNATSAEKLYIQLKNRELKDYKLGILHGKLKNEQKEEVMKKFVNHQLDVLVSTTVIEVGVDVSNATVMCIYSADRFGLAQLHQLRGRVGRAEHIGLCYLIMSDSAAPSKRIRAIEQTTDGFKLAELDLKIRGPGAIYGVRQHGLLDLKIAELADTRLINKVRLAVNDFVDQQENLLKYKIVSEKIKLASRLTYLN